MIGSEASNGVNDVTIQDVYLQDTSYGFRIKSRRDRGAAIYGITVQDVVMAGVFSPLNFNDYYNGAEQQNPDPAQLTAIVKGSGSDIWNTADEFQFDYQMLAGDGTITARVASETNTDAWAKAGVMIRETLAANSTHALVAVTSANGVAFQRRVTTGGQSTHTSGPMLAVPYWVRLTRSGNTFSAYASPNGATWTAIAQDTITMGASVYIGLAVTAHNDGAVNTAFFDHVVVAPLPRSTGTWSNQDIGSVAAAGSSSDTTPNIHDIWLQDVTANNASVDSIILGLPESCIRNVTLNKVNIDSDGLQLHHMTGTFTDVTSNPPVVDDNVTVKNADGTPLYHRAPQPGQVACSHRDWDELGRELELFPLRSAKRMIPAGCG